MKDIKIKKRTKGEKRSKKDIKILLKRKRKKASVLLGT